MSLKYRVRIKGNRGWKGQPMLKQNGECKTVGLLIEGTLYLPIVASKKWKGVK